MNLSVAERPPAQFDVLETPLSDDEHERWGQIIDGLGFLALPVSGTPIFDQLLSEYHHPPDLAVRPVRDEVKRAHDALLLFGSVEAVQGTSFDDDVVADTPIWRDIAGTSRPVKRVASTADTSSGNWEFLAPGEANDEMLERLLYQLRRWNTNDDSRPPFTDAPGPMLQAVGSAA